MQLQPSACVRACATIVAGQRHSCRGAWGGGSSPAGHRHTAGSPAPPPPSGSGSPLEMDPRSTSWTQGPLEHRGRHRLCYGTGTLWYWSVILCRGTVWGRVIRLLTQHFLWWHSVFCFMFFKFLKDHFKLKFYINVRWRCLCTWPLCAYVRTCSEKNIIKLDGWDWQKMFKIIEDILRYVNVYQETRFSKWKIN